MHCVAVLFWGFVGIVAGEMSLLLTTLLVGGSVVVATGLVLSMVGHSLGRRVLIAGDAIPLALGVVVFAWLTIVAAREGELANLVAQSGAALALYLPAAIGPLLLAIALPNSRV